MRESDRNAAPKVSHFRSDAKNIEALITTTPDMKRKVIRRFHSGGI